MAFQMILNFVLAFVWMFLSSNYTATGFIIGFIMGILLLILMRRFFKSRLYVYRLWALLNLTLLFFKELILANVQVLKVVLKPKSDMQPAFCLSNCSNTRLGNHVIVESYYFNTRNSRSACIG